MSHKSGVIIISSLKRAPDITAVQRERLVEIEQRDEYTFLDRCYIAWVAYILTGER